MEADTVRIPRQEYEKLLQFKRVDQELLTDIAKGIKDILEGRVREV